MGLFYIHHRWLNFYRKGDHLKLLVVIFFLAMFVFRLGNAFLIELSSWVTELSGQFQISELDTFKLILTTFFVGMTGLKVNISPATLHYEPYRLWPIDKKSIAIQYVLLSHLKPANFFWLFFEGALLIKATEFDMNVISVFLAFWFIQHYLNIVLHPHSLFKWTTGIVLMLLATAMFKGWLGFTWLTLFFEIAPSLFIVAGISLIMAIFMVRKMPISYLKRQKIGSQLFTMEIGELADPLFDLELKLIWRNKSTRTNLIFGFLSIPILLYYFSNAGIPEGVYFMAIITTGLVLLQHGIYTMSWEGNYFDMLMIRFTSSEFMHFKFRFYMLATLIGLVLSSMTLFVNVGQWLPLVAAFLYNISWNCYMVLYGVMGNKKKLALGQSIIFKSESMTANVLTVSFMTIILPMLLLGVLAIFLVGDQVYYGIMAFSLIGLAFRNQILKLLAVRLDKKKYELSMAFHE